MSRHLCLAFLTNLALTFETDRSANLDVVINEEQQYWHFLKEVGYVKAELQVRDSESQSNEGATYLTRRPSLRTPFLIIPQFIFFIIINYAA